MSVWGNSWGNSWGVSWGSDEALLFLGGGWPMGIFFADMVLK